MRRVFYSFLLLCCLFASPHLLRAQSRSVSGTVSNNKGEPVPMATVQQKGTVVFATASETGQFSINVSGTNVILVISSTGYITKEVNIGDATSYDIILEESGALSEVVVTALGITREKKALGYAAQEVKADELNRNLQPNLVNALQGKVAGTTISSIGGGPGQGASIRIRGINSIDVGQSNEPLFVIDGVLMDNSTSSMGATRGDVHQVRSVGNRASDINPEDIETINVLKGGAATALYGLRGANGVIVITTKKGKAGTMRVNASSTYGVENINKYPAVQKEYTAGILGAYVPIGLGPAWGPTIEEAKAIDPDHPDELYENYKQAYRTGKQSRQSINMAGGNDVVNYFSSVSYFNHEGMMFFTDYSNLTARLNTDIKVSSKFKSTVNMTFSNSGGYRFEADRYGESLAYFSPRWNVRDYQNEDGTQLWRGTNNPIFGAATNRMKDNVNRFVGGIGFGYQPVKWLDLSYRVGLDTYNDNRFRTAPGLRGIPGEANYDNSLGFVGDYNTNFRAINSTLLASVNTAITSDLNLVVRAGHELYDRSVKQTGVLGSQLTVFNWYNLRNAAVLEPVHNTTLYRLMGIFGEVNLDYKNFLFLSVTGRNDITSTLRKPNNSFFYPSVNLSYVFSDHFSLPEFISYSKLRLSYAKIGKDALPYSTATGYGAYSSLPPGVTGFTRGANLGDPLLRPEFTNTYEAGLEMSFLNRRIGFDFTYYHSISEDQIINALVSSATGYVRAAVNSGSMRNKGVEIILRGTPVSNKNFTWESNLNFSANRNKVLSLREGLDEIPYGTHPGYGIAAVTMKLMPGLPYGSIFGTHYVRHHEPGHVEDPIRLDRSLPIVIGADGFPVTAPVSSQKYLGNSQPDWIAGFTNNFTYKRFTLSTLIDARWGFEKYSRLENFFSAFGIADYTTDRRDFKVFDGVLADGTPNTKSVWLGQAVGPDGVNYGEGYYRRFHRWVSEYFVSDASWVRLRSASLAYALPDSWIQRSKFIRNASVSVTGNNLILITKYYGLDPESVSADAGSNVDGFSGFTYPAARSFLFTLNLGF
ncbi:MAG: SusC/RagA family TonB-linked outer membrane protein [Chitinophagaceae bacterium]|nr:SusC/RagA family TonB-linked outer membrane protein [Chitinophagaceae bacterium]MCW5927477.1 SusC/RagA family TonB-linked outer membrane protein [Chitinophagaceae bacterium]